MVGRVLVTGANGFVGSCLVRMLGGTGWQVVPLVRRSSGLRGEVTLDFCEGNFGDKVHLLPKMDAVVHLGAQVKLGGGAQVELFRPNVLASGHLATWAAEMGAYFVFASSVIVYGVRTIYISSESVIKPDTDYAYSKWLAEELIRMSGVKCGILRIAGVFGKSGPSHLGINVAIDNALKGIAPVQYGEGAVKRNYVYVEDLCSVIRFCIERRLEGTHLVAGSSVNLVSEMLEIICETLLPGRRPQRVVSGSIVYDQIIEHSPHLPQGRSFKEAIVDIGRSAKVSV